MARRFGRRNSGRRWMYNVSALFVIAAAVIFVYRPSIKNTDETPAALADTAVQNETVLPLPPAVPQPKLSHPAPAAAAEPDSRVTQLIAGAMKCLEATPPGIIEARDRLNDTLAMPMSGQQQAYVKEQLSILADKWLFSRTVFPGDGLCGAYEVQPGDLLLTIGKQSKVPYEVLLELNGISRAGALQAGRIIKVINGPFHARISRSTFTLDLYLQNTFVRSFPVGLGRAGMETPTGLWTVKSGGKLIKPAWTNPVTGRRYEADDPDYPLGSRWIGLEGLQGDAVGRNGFAIHGTNNPQEVGMPSSQGCIRLRDSDAVLVYNLLMPVYSQVEITE
jgi:hypothetical protein